MDFRLGIAKIIDRGRGRNRDRITSLHTMARS